MRNIFKYLLAMVLFMQFSCNKDTDNSEEFIPKDPDNAEIAAVDRFGEFATLYKRSLNSTLPAANAPVNFDAAPFTTQAFGPHGKIVKYYNFDVQSENAAPLYLLFRKSENQPVANQLPIFDVIPGDTGYNDFWRVYKVTVPDNYVANAITSYNEIYLGNYPIAIESTLINCPVVSKGSTAIYKYNNNPTNEIHRAWYKSKIVYYFSFEEKELSVNSSGNIPVSPVYVTFNINPDPENSSSGPASGLPTEPGTQQTHSVLATLPSDALYSPLWTVYVYNNADFEQVNDLISAQNVNHLAENVMLVNCPVYYTEN